MLGLSFTFHYVSIKSQSVIIVSPGLSLFTFHYVSIKSMVVLVI